jgi:hypothetical protein
MASLKTLPPSDDSTPMLATAAAPVTPTVTKGANAAAHSSDNNTVGEY